MAVVRPSGSATVPLFRAVARTTCAFRLASGIGATLRHRRVGAADESSDSISAVSFQSLPDHELHQLSDEDLIAYIRDARDAGRAPPRAPGPDVPRLRLRARRQAAAVDQGAGPRRRRPRAGGQLARAIAAAFDGSSVGEFRNWLHTIVDGAGGRLLPSRRAASEGRRSGRASTPARRTSGARSRRSRARPARSSCGSSSRRLETFNEKHRLVIELHVFGGFTTAEVCARIKGMSEDNVAQIASRFRAKLRARLEPGGGL